MGMSLAELCDWQERQIAELEHKCEFLIEQIKPTGGSCPEDWNEDCDDVDADCAACWREYLQTNKPWEATNDTPPD